MDIGLTPIVWKHVDGEIKLMANKLLGYEFETKGKKIREMQSKLNLGPFVESMDREVLIKAMEIDDDMERGQFMTRNLNLSVGDLLGYRIVIPEDILKAYYEYAIEFVTGWEGLKAGGEEIQFNADAKDEIKATIYKLDFASIIQPFVDYVVDESDLTQERQDFLASGSGTGSPSPIGPTAPSAKRKRKNTKKPVENAVD